MYRILHNDFTFVTTSDMETSRKEQGWEFDYSFPFELAANKSEEAYQVALQLAKESDVVIIGAAPEIFVKERMRANTTGITFRYSERIYKRGTWRSLSPRGWVGKLDTYFRYHNRKLFMLCASAYTSGDLKLQASYLGKCYKWGYFPKVINYDLKSLMVKKAKEKIEILWCGRLIRLKHPEVALALASMLKKDGIDFTLNIVGAGEEENLLKAMIVDNKLEPYVKLLSAKPPEQVRKCMEEANIFLFTSDFEEGWGAVVNEAMNSGCVVVASHAAGSVPYLIQDGVNGLIYKYGDLNSLYHKVNLLINKKQLCENLGSKAYETIVNIWNAENAVKRLLLLIEDLNNEGNSCRFHSGPCSKAEEVGNNWYKERLE